MLQKFKEHININFPFLKDKRLLIAISGGLDSIVLTQLLSSLNFDVTLAHCNFQLREKESDLDEEFVKNLSKKMSSQIFVKKIDTETYTKKHKLSTQIAARELRYNWFQELIKKYNYDYLLTAHHADDNLETFLINLTRGSGLEGFTGIPKINGNIVRPMLPFSRAEIQKYAEKNNIKWREDASNASTKYVRNKIRHKVIPILKELNPSLLETFAKTTENLQESQQIIEDRIEDVSLNIIKKDFSTSLEMTKLNIEKINQLSNPKAYLYQLLKGENFTEWNDVYNLLSAQSGKQVFSKTHRLLKDRNFLILSKRDFSTALEKTFEIKESQSEIIKPIHLTFKEVQEKTTENKRTIYLDKDLLKYPLTIKKWGNGEYICPIGMKGSKKISKFFKDLKYSLIDKENTWLLYNNNNEVIWIIGERQDRRFSITKNTKKTVKITLK